MLTFKQGDIVRVPFPYTDRETRQHRPALVISDGSIGEDGRLLWVVMITSAENRRWPGDQEIGPDYQKVGLPAPSIIRPTKVATIETRDAEPIGHISHTLMQHVLIKVGQNLALPQKRPSA